MFQAHIRPAFSHIVNQGCNHYILYMMTLILKLENFFATQSVFARYPLCLYALRAQMKLHRLFPKTFAHTPTNQFHD